MSKWCRSSDWRATTYQRRRQPGSLARCRQRTRWSPTRARRERILAVMQRWFFETHNELNWGKFMVCGFDGVDWAVRSVVDNAYHQSLLGGRGWSPEHLLVFDLETGEGAMFKPGGSPRADLRKHQIWVCPMFDLTDPSHSGRSAGRPCP